MAAGTILVVLAAVIWPAREIPGGMKDVWAHSNRPRPLAEQQVCYITCIRSSGLLSVMFPVKIRAEESSAHTPDTPPQTCSISYMWFSTSADQYKMTGIVGFLAWQNISSTGHCKEVLTATLYGWRRLRWRNGLGGRRRNHEGQASAKATSPWHVTHGSCLHSLSPLAPACKTCATAEGLRLLEITALVSGCISPAAMLMRIYASACLWSPISLLVSRACHPISRSYSQVKS